MIMELRVRRGVELLMAGHRELMACGLRERPKRAAEHAGPPGDQKPLR
jgi:hypothetical protein